MKIKVTDVNINLKNGNNVRLYGVEKNLETIQKSMQYDFVSLTHVDGTEIISTPEIVRVNVSKPYYTEI